MSSSQQPDPPQLNDSSIQTYRYVRAAIIGSVLLLFLAVLLQIIADDGAIESSVSEYYYGPVRGVFVGILVATGVSLVAIKGRPLVEEVSLNLAGMMAPVVAFVPTPLPASEVTCREGVTRCIDPEYLPSVVNNMSALILIGPPILAFAWWLAVRGDVPRSTRLSLLLATVFWAGFAIWFFWGPRVVFLESAHYVAAIAMFGLIIVVVWYNALRTNCHVQFRRVSVPYRTVYFSVAAAMAIALVASVVIYFATSGMPRESWSVVFWLEAVLLTLFVIFWIAQTREFWDEGLPVEACAKPDA